MNLQQWLEYLESCHPSTIELGLDRISQVASKLPIDFSNIKIITVAGTNGKGSTVTMLSAILQAGGYRTATYASPHIRTYNERVMLGDRYATDEELCESFAAVEAVRGDIKLTYFEFGTLAALQLFSACQPDVVILEVGLGGRLDAVNMLDPDIAIVTNVALDHTDWLGDTREAIGSEKAGIYRPGKPALVGEVDIPASVLSHAHDIGATLYANGDAFHALDTGFGNWQWQGRDAKGIAITLDLKQNNYPLDNCATVIQAILLLAPGINEQAIASGLANAELPGRFQVIDRGYPLILDVGHNPHAAQRVKTQVESHYPGFRVVLLVAMLADKDYASVLSVYRQLVPTWVVAGIQEERGLAAKILYNYLLESGETDVRSCDTIVEAFKVAEQVSRDIANSGEKVLLLVTGSFFTVSGVMELV